MFRGFIMNLVSDQQTNYHLLINHEFTIYNAKSLSFSGIQYESTIFFASFFVNSLSISRLNYDSFSVSRINYQSREFSGNSLSISRIYLKFSIISRQFNMNSVSVPRISVPRVSVLTISFAITLWIHHLFRVFTIFIKLNA